MKSCNKSVKLRFYYSKQKYDDSITRYFPFSKREFSKKIKCCVYIMHGKFSGSFPIILSYKTDECFIFTKRFSLQVGNI